MTEVEKIRSICSEKGETFASIERACGFANGYLGSLKKGFLPPDRLEKIAKYLGVTANYIRGKEENVDYVIKSGEEEILIELFRKEKDDGILHKYIEAAKAFKGDK